MQSFHDSDGKEVKTIDSDTDLAKIAEVCCKGHSINHSNFYDVFYMPLDKDFFSHAWSLAFEKERLFQSINKCDNPDVLEEKLLQCPLTAENNFRCTKKFEKDELIQLLDDETLASFNEYYAKIQECRSKIGRSEVLKSQDIIENESLFNYYGYLKKLILVRDSDISKYIPTRFCPERFVQIGIHPITLQYLEMVEGCQYLHFDAIKYDDEDIGKKYYSTTKNNYLHATNEVCIICGRPCRNHNHLPIDGFTTDVWDKTDDDKWINFKNGEIKTEISENDTKFSDMDIIDCGGRREMIARVWGIYTEFIKCEKSKSVVDIENPNQGIDYKENAAKLANTVATNENILNYIDEIIKNNEPPFILEDTSYEKTSYIDKNLITMKYSIEELNKKMENINELLEKRKKLSGGKIRNTLKHRFNLKKITKRKNKLNKKTKKKYRKNKKTKKQTKN